VGTFLKVDDSFYHSNTCPITCMLVKVDLMDGLTKEINIEVRNKHYCFIDYVGVPF
jgi:hypothetical protein